MQSSTSTVRRRSIFLIGGYEPKSSEAFFRRTGRELKRFCETWQVEAAMGEQQLSDDGLVATAQLQSTVHGCQVATSLNFFVWNDIVLSDFARPTLVRLARYLVTLCDYLITGTFWHIFREAWRFSLYFLYPACMLALFVMLGVGLGWGIAQTALPAAAWWGALAGGWLVYGLLKWSGRRWFVMHLMDLWSFSREHLRGRRADAESHLERFAEAVVAQARRGEMDETADDEIVLVGHSTGGALILEIAAIALTKYPQLGQVGSRVTILTVGSTALKIGLHPAAERFRQRVQTLVNAPAINWIECQAHTDIVNFYKTDPVAAMHLNSTRSDLFPAVHVVRVRDMLQPEIYRRFKFNFFRVHYQFIMANTKRYAYDFFMMCCGEKLLAEMLGESLRYRPASSRLGCESMADAVRSGRFATQRVSEGHVIPR